MLRYDVLNEKRRRAIGHRFARGFLPKGGHPLVLFRWRFWGADICISDRSSLVPYWVDGRYGKRFSVILSSCTLREAMTKKGRCSVFR